MEQARSGLPPVTGSDRLVRRAGHLSCWKKAVRLNPPTESEFGDLPIAAPYVRVGSGSDLIVSFEKRLLSGVKRT